MSLFEKYMPSSAMSASACRPTCGWRSHRNMTGPTITHLAMLGAVASEHTAHARPGDRGLPLSVEALARIAAQLLEDQIGTIWVEGELSSLRVPSSGHVYFVLKDRRAQLAAI